MNQQASTASDSREPAPTRPGQVIEDVAAALRLPGPLGRSRDGLPVAAGAPLIPTALSTFNRLTGRLDQDADSDAPPADITELSGTPVEPARRFSTSHR